MCDICSSNLLDELNKKRNWRPDRVIKWAHRRGLEITEKELRQHFAGHEPLAKESHAGKVPKKPARNAAKPREKSKDTGAAQPVADAGKANNEFLDEVVRRVFDSLRENKFDLKLEHGFKAIEIQQKIEDKSDTENMLLELLNEIRRQELA